IRDDLVTGVQTCALPIYRCIPRRMAVLTWYGLRGALEPWCHRRGWLLPPRPYLVAWLDSHYTRVDQSEELPRWAGLALTMEEWRSEEGRVGKEGSVGGGG